MTADDQRRLDAAYAACFCDELGQLTPSALDVIDDIAAHSFETKSTAQAAGISPSNPQGMVDPVQMAVNEGVRLAFIRLRNRIDLAVKRRNNGYAD